MKPAAANSTSTVRPQGTRTILWLTRCIVAGTVGISLCGCALHRPPSHPTIVDQALPKATPLPPAWTSTPNSAAPNNDVADNWVKSFQDPGLDSVVSEAIANNLDLRQSAARVEEARQSVIVVGAKLRPQVGANLAAATTRSTDKDVTQQNQSSMVLGEVSWEVDVWGRLRSQRAAARENYQTIALDYGFARQSIAATTAKSWYLAIETRQLLTLTEQAVNIYQQLLELVKIRRAAGKVADLDVAEASYQLDEAQSELIATQGLYSESRRALELLVGRYPAAELKVAEAFVPLPPPVAPGLPSTLLERRPDIAAAEHQVLAAFRTAEAAKLALLPSFSLNLEGGRLSDPLLSVLGLNPWLVHAAAGMLLPIYEGGALRAQVKIATAQQEQSVAHFGGVSLTAFTEVEVALTNEQLLAKRLPYGENAVRDHTEAVRIASLRYKAGSMDLLSVLQLQAGQIQSQADLIRLRNTQLANRINLHLALGGSFDSSPATNFTAATAVQQH
jgi:NodT family efflux transporter outer membrane factor (OMF) lipoprotein